MDGDTATRFIASLTKSLQAVIHGCLDFENDIELGGYVYLRVDSAQRVDYVLNEKMQKGDTNSLTFHSNSFHALPQPAVERRQHSRDRHDGSLNASALTEYKSPDDGRHFSSTSKVSHLDSDCNISRTSDSFLPPQSGVGSDAEFRVSSGSVRQPSSNTRNATVTSSEGSGSRDRSQSLTDFQTAFRNPSASLTSQSPQSSMGGWGIAQNGNNPRLSSGSSQPLHHQHQQQQGKAGILPDASEMEVVHIKTEEEDDMFNIPLPCQQGGSESDGLAVQGKAPWLAMRMRQPFYFPYSRLARSQSWDRRMSVPAAGPRFPFFSRESSSDAASLTCKECGKSYRSRQGLLFHERAKHQNVFNVYCPLCGKGFQQTTHMHGHMATHTNVKNFQCQACGAKYAHKTSLQQHLRSGSCRASQGQGSAGGLDLSTSQILRDFSPYSLSEPQPRPSPAHSQTHSPLEPDFNHSEGEMTMHQKQTPSFSPSDVTSPPDHLDDSFPGGEGMADHGSGMDMTCGSDGTAGDLTSDGQAMGPSLTACRDEDRDHNRMGGKEARGGTLSSGERTQDVDQINSQEGQSVELTGRDVARGFAIMSPGQTLTLGVDMSKSVQDYDFTADTAPADTVRDENFTTSTMSTNRHDSVFGHDTDMHETVSLSLSADDD